MLCGIRSTFDNELDKVLYMLVGMSELVDTDYDRSISV